MARTITVVTPENITLTYQAAGIASRFMAVVIDLLIQFATAILVLLGIQQIVGKNNQGGIGPGSLLTSAGTIFVTLIMPFAYAIFFELLWGGRTPGKRLLRLRAVRDGGYPLTPLSSIIRNLLRVIDFGILVTTTPLILCGLPGLICMFFSPQYKRIGDYAAGTLVVIESEAESASDDTNPEATAGGRHKRNRRNGNKRGRGQLGDTTSPNRYEPFLPYIRNIDRLTLEDYRLLRRFVACRGSLEPMVEAGLAERLARPLMSRMEIDIPIYYQLQYADLLHAIERCYADQRGLVDNSRQFHQI